MVESANAALGGSSFTSRLAGRVEEFLSRSRTEKALWLHGVLTFAFVVTSLPFVWMSRWFEELGILSPEAIVLIEGCLFITLVALGFNTLVLWLVRRWAPRHPRTEFVLLAILLVPATAGIFACVYPFGLISFLLIVPLGALICVRVVIDRAASLVFLAIIAGTSLLITYLYFHGLLDYAPYLPAEYGARFLSSEPLFLIMTLTWIGLAVVVLLIVDHGMQQIGVAQSGTNALLENMLPAAVVKSLRQGVQPAARQYDDVPVLYARIDGFGQMSQKMTPDRLQDLLNRLVMDFDLIARRHKLEKIRTHGDVYMLVAGVPESHPDPCGAVAECALEMQAAAGVYRDHHGNAVCLCTGIAVGAVVAGVVGKTRIATYGGAPSVKRLRCRRKQRPGPYAFRRMRAIGLASVLSSRAGSCSWGRHERQG